MNGNVTQATLGNLLFIQFESTLHFKTAQVDALRFQNNVNHVPQLQRGLKDRFTVNNWQCNRWIILSTSRENCSSCQAIAFETFFPGLMTPAKDVLKVHNTGGVGVAEANASLQLQPARYLSGQPIP